MQHLGVRLAEFGSGTDAELVRQPAPDVVEKFQRGGLPSRSGEGEHQPGVGGLVQRFFGDQCLQVSHGVAMITLCQQGIGVLEHDRRPPLDQREPGRMLAEHGEIGQRRAAPQPQRDVVLLTRDRRFEPEQIELFLLHRKEIALLRRDDHPGGLAGVAPRLEGPAQPRDIGVDQIQAGRRRPLAPDDVDDVLAPDDPVRVQGKQSEQKTLLLRADLDGTVAAPHGQRAEHADARECGRALFQRLPQLPFGFRARPGTAEFGVAHRAKADTASLGQLGLRQARARTPLPQPLGERRSVIHRRFLSERTRPGSARCLLSHTPNWPPAAVFAVQQR